MVNDQTTREGMAVVEYLKAEARKEIEAANKARADRDAEQIHKSIAAWQGVIQAILDVHPGLPGLQMPGDVRHPPGAVPSVCLVLPGHVGILIWMVAVEGGTGWRLNGGSPYLVCRSYDGCGDVIEGTDTYYSSLGMALLAAERAHWKIQQG